MFKKEKVFCRYVYKLISNWLTEIMIVKQTSKWWK